MYIDRQKLHSGRQQSLPLGKARQSDLKCKDKSTCLGDKLREPVQAHPLAPLYTETSSPLAPLARRPQLPVAWFVSCLVRPSFIAGRFAACSNPGRCVIGVGDPCWREVAAKPGWGNGREGDKEKEQGMEWVGIEGRRKEPDLSRPSKRPAVNCCPLYPQPTHVVYSNVLITTAPRFPKHVYRTMRTHNPVSRIWQVVAHQKKRQTSARSIRPARPVRLVCPLSSSRRRPPHAIHPRPPCFQREREREEKREECR